LGGGGRGGGGGGGTGGASLVGTWRNLTTFFDASGETIVSETDWTFAPGGACSKVVTHTFVSAGVQDTVFQGSCTYAFGGSSVTIRFTGSSVPSTFSVAFSNGELMLEGSPYQRIA